MKGAENRGGENRPAKRKKSAINACHERIMSINTYHSEVGF